MSVNQEQEQEQDRPRKTDDGWHDYVMSQFTEDELVNGNPKYVGLRRVFEKVYAKILNVDNVVIKPPLTEDLTATVTCRMECREHDSGDIITQSSSADVSHYNTETMFAKHPVSTAETRAEGRTLRKLLGLKTITAEEAMAGDVENQVVNDQTVRGIKNMASKIKVNLDKLLSREAGINLTMLDNNPNMLTMDQGKRILKLLNEYGDMGVPTDLRA